MEDTKRGLGLRMKIMRMVWKIVAFLPLCVLTVFSWATVFIVGLATGTLAMISGLLLLTGLTMFFLNSPATGLQMLLAAFLISPYGIPMIAFYLSNGLLLVTELLRQLVYR